METLQPKLRFPEFKKNLVRCKLSEKMNVFRGASPRPKGDPKYYGGSVPRLMIQDATRDGKYVYPKIDFLTELGAEKSRLLKKDSVVLSCSGTIVAIPTILGVDACIHDGWLGFNNFKNVSTEFLYYNFVKLHEIMQGSATTGGVFNNLTTSIIKDYEISFPSLEEQTKIANFLSSVDEKLNLLKEKKELLESYKKGIMQKIFNQELRFKDDNGNDFEEWEEKTFGEMSTIRRGASPRPITDPKWFDESSGIGWVRISDVTKSNKYLLKTEQYLSEEGVNKSRLVKKGNLIMSICATIGKPIYTDFDVCIHDGFVVFEDLKGYREYFYYYLQYIQKNWYNYGQPGTQVNLNSDIVSNELLLFPSLREQTKIANFLSAIDEKIDLIANQIQDTQEYKKGLLQQMFV